MTLRAKTLLIIGLSTICIILLPYFQLQRILRQSATDIEGETARQIVKRAQSTIENELKELRGITGRWASWPETYELLQGKGEDYPAVDFTSSMFLDLDLSVFMFTGYDGRLIYAKGYDSQAGKEIAVPASLISIPGEYPELRARMFMPEGVSGFLLIDGQPMLVAAKPVKKYGDSGQVLGALLIGRYLKVAHSKALSEELGEPILLYQAEDPRTPRQLEGLTGNAKLPGSQVVYSANSDSISSYTLQKDLTGKRLLVLQVDSPRNASEDSRTNVYRFIFSMLPTVILFGILMMLLLEHLILSRLSRLTRRVAHITTSGNFHERVTISGRDEIATLSWEISRMLTALQESHDALGVSEERYRTLIEHQGEGIGSVDENEVFTFCNPVAEEIFGVAPGMLVGKGLREFTSPFVWEQVRKETSRRRLGEKTTYMLEIARPNGQRRQILLTATPWFKNDGTYGGALAIFRDETIRLRAEAGLRQVEAMRRQFFDGASHELKTPLTAVLGMVETLLRGAVDAETRDRYLQRIREQTVRMSTLIEDLLTLSRLEAAEDVLRIEVIDLCEPVLDAVDGVMDVAEAKGVRIVADVPDSHHFVRGDRDGLSIMVSNLLDNAIKYTPSGGTVYVSCQQEDGSVSLEVADTGIGIDPSEYERIFERFYRVDRARSREMGGTGLGLSIVSELAKLQNASVSVKSELAKGSVFTLRFPAAPNPPA